MTFPGIPGAGALTKAVLEYDSLADFPATGSASKLYIDGDTSAVYRWDGANYVPITAAGVLEFANLAAFPATGISATLYIATDTGSVYRWTGSAYALISGGGGGSSDHGTLTGLGDDDHTQYLNNARGDARYALLAHSHAEYLSASLFAGNIGSASVGQVLKWNGSAYAPAADSTGGGGSTVADADYGDISVTAAGSIWTIDDGVVTLAKLGGTITAAGKALLDDADAAAQRTTLGLGTAATQASSAFEVAGATATHAAVSTAHGISAFGSSLVGSVDASAARTVLGVNDAFLLDRTNHIGTQAASTISDFSEAVDDRVATLLTAGSNVTLNYNDATNTLTISAAGAGGGATLADGDYGDVTVSGTGTVITIDNASVTLAKMANIATASIIGRTTAGTGVPEALTAAQVRTILSLVIGTDVQAYSANLTALGGVTSAADKVPYYTGSGTAAVADFTAAGRTLVAAINAAAQRSALGLVIGTDVQQQSANLSAIAGLASAANQLGYFTGSGTAALTGLTVAGRALLDDADAAAQRTTLGLGTIATLAAPSGTVVGTTDTQTLTNKTLTAPVISSISNTGTLTLPTSTDTLVGRATTDTLTNKTLTSPTINGTWTAAGAQIVTPATVTFTTNAGTLTVSNAFSTGTNAANATLSFSGTIPSGQWVSFEFTNGDAVNPITLTIPSSYSMLRQTAITSFVVPAGAVVQLTWRGTGSTPRLYGETPPDGFLAEQTVASATTTDIGAATSVNVAISGTTTITGLGTAAAGTYRQGRFTGVLTFTHNGTSLILPNNGSNITTAANDRFGAYSLGSGNWLVLWYQRANGQALVSGGGVSDGDKGDVTVSAAGATWTIDAGAVSYSKIQNVSATARVLGRNTAGAGVIEEVTLSQLLDFVGSAAQGDILYRGASAWTRLGAGTSGQFLQTQGTGANPQWSTPAGSGDVSSNTATSVDGELVLFNATSGKSVKRAALTGMLKATSGVAAAATQGSDYYAPGGTDVAVADGGTGLSSGTSGGVLAFTATGTLASSAALTNNGLVLGGGAGAVPKVAAGLATDGTSQIQLGVAGTSVGSVLLRNATSGSITIQPPTGALGTVTLTAPAATDTLAALAATQTLTNKTLTSPTVTGGSLQVAALPGANNTYEGQVITGRNAGATIAQWDAVYLDASGTWQLADANGTGTFPARGLAVAAYANTNPAIVLFNGVARNDTWAWTIGGDVFLSTTAGGLTQTAPSASGDKIQKIGWAPTADSIMVSIGSGEYLTVT